MNVVEYCASETERQSGTPMEVWGMYRAYQYLVRRSFVEVPESAIVKMQAEIKRRLSEGYRTVPAVFNQGPPAMAAIHVPQAMRALVEAQSQMDEYQLAYEFLEIHPFSDGNGRVASLLFNWKSGTLQRPDPLPTWEELQQRGKFSYS